MQYWTHRAYHEVPILWRLHAVHHSAKSMDWLAGSRQHILGLLITRTLVLAPIYVLGFLGKMRDRRYIVIVGFQAVFNHANVSVLWPAALHHRDAQFSPLASQPGPGGAGPQLCGALRLPRLPVRHRGEKQSNCGPSATAFSATTCRTASSKQFKFPFTWRADGGARTGLSLPRRQFARPCAKCTACRQWPPKPARAR